MLLIPKKCRCGSDHHRRISAAQYNNPQETYNYYYLPFCKPTGAGKAAHKWGGLGEVLEGNQLIDSQLDVRYRCECPDTLISRCLASAWRLQGTQDDKCQGGTLGPALLAKCSWGRTSSANALAPGSWKRHCTLPYRV